MLVILGAVLAGGASRRFGSDKALAEWDGRALIEWAVAALARQCARVVVIGRESAPVATLPDWPRPGTGPLGGLAAALRYAGESGCDAVLSCPVDAVVLPDDLAERLRPAPACLAAQPVIGLWPAVAAPQLEALLQGDGPHSMRRFAELVGARLIAIEAVVPNVNTPADLEALGRRP